MVPKMLTLAQTRGGEGMGGSRCSCMLNPEQVPNQPYTLSN